MLSKVADVTGIVKYIFKSMRKSSARPNFCLFGGGRALDPPAPLLRHLCMGTCYCLKGIGKVLSKLCFTVLRWIVNISEHKSRSYSCLAILTKKP